MASYNMQIPDLSYLWRLPTARSGSTDDIWFEIDKSHEADPEPYHIMVSSRKNANATPEVFARQIEFTRLLISRLEAKGCQVEFNGYFEEYLER